MYNPVNMYTEQSGRQDGGQCMDMLRARNTGVDRIGTADGGCNVGFVVLVRGTLRGQYTN